MKKWQFDVWSHAVTIANRMESGGEPGKIHITETTHAHLGGKYNLEPAYGEERDEMLQNRKIKVFSLFVQQIYSALIQTYFILGLAKAEERDEVVRGSKKRKHNQSRKEMRIIGYDDDTQFGHPKTGHHKR